MIEQHSIGAYKMQFADTEDHGVDVSLAFQHHEMTMDIARAGVKYKVDSTLGKCMQVENSWISTTAPVVQQVGVLESGKKLAAMIVQLATRQHVRDIFVPSDIKILFSRYASANSPVRIH